MPTQQQIQFMDAAIDQAKQAALLDEVPIGAVVVYHGQIIGAGHNMRERFNDATYHAEMLAIEEACTARHSWRLLDCDLYVTLEPCIMCSGAIINARLRHLYYGAPDKKAGGVSSLYHLLDDDRLNHQVGVSAGLCADQCSQLLKSFFKAARQRHKAAKRKQRRLQSGENAGN